MSYLAKWAGLHHPLFDMAHVLESAGRRSLAAHGKDGRASLTVQASAPATQTTPRVYRFQPRKGRLALGPLAQVDVGAIILKSDHGALQGHLRSIVFGKVSRPSWRFARNATVSKHMATAPMCWRVDTGQSRGCRWYT